MVDGLDVGKLYQSYVLKAVQCCFGALITLDPFPSGRSKGSPTVKH